MSERTDGQLLDEFARTRSEEALAELIERHGRMVYNSCLRVLGNGASAEDAAQASFAVLARKARRIASRADAGGWLHKVAVETALNLRKSEARRRAREKEAGEMIARGRRADAGWEQVSQSIDAALARLSAAQRDAVVGVYLEGRTQAEVARALGVPAGTVDSRCRTGISKLRRILSGSGLSVVAVALGDMLLENAGSAALPSVFSSLPETCAAFAAKGAAGAGGGNALRLAEGTMKMMTATKIKAAAAVLCVTTVLCGGGALTVQQLAAGEAVGKPGAKHVERKGALAKLPGRPGPHIAKIKALGDNQWLVLGKPAADAKWGVARGRAWGGRAFAYASDLRGAFFCGTGVHGYIKPNGHYMDDLWFYDANAHKWICLYPGANTKTLKLKLDEHGFEVDEKGEHIPVSYLSHANSNMTYDPVRRKLMIVWLNCPWWPEALPQRWNWLDDKYPLVKKCKQARAGGQVGWVIAASKHPLYWDVATGKWERRFVAGDGPNPRGASHCIGVAEYIPSRKKLVFVTKSKVWAYDYAENSWTVESTDTTKRKSGWWDNGCYDTKRQRLYFTYRDRTTFASYDFKTKTWKDIKAEGQPEKLGQSNETCLAYDSANDVLVWHGKGLGERGHMMVYEPDANKWTKLERTFPDGVRTKGMGLMGFYDPDLNAHFFYLARDSNNKHATMLVYRYKRRRAAARGRDG